MTDKDYKNFFFDGGEGQDNISNAPVDSYEITLNKNSLTSPLPEENVEEIRNSAPDWFKMGNRLITKKDYEYFIKSYGEVFSGVTDVKCMNNWDYMTTLYRWLFNLGI
jgi:hypothetical protein